MSSKMAPEKVRSQLTSVKKKRIKKIIDGCEHCWGRVDEIHHIVSVAVGGQNNEGNLIVLCSNCHTDVDYGKLKPSTMYEDIKQRSDNTKKKIEAIVNGTEEPKGFIEGLVEGFSDWFNKEF